MLVALKCYWKLTISIVLLYSCHKLVPRKDWIDAFNIYIIQYLHYAFLRRSTYNIFRISEFYVMSCFEIFLKTDKRFPKFLFAVQSLFYDKNPKANVYTFKLTKENLKQTHQTKCLKKS